MMEATSYGPKHITVEYSVIETLIINADSLAMPIPMI